jgi:hypothetical protein
MDWPTLFGHYERVLRQLKDQEFTRAIVNDQGTTLVLTNEINVILPVFRCGDSTAARPTANLLSMLGFGDAGKLFSYLAHGDELLAYKSNGSSSSGQVFGSFRIPPSSSEGVE